MLPLSIFFIFLAVSFPMFEVFPVGDSQKTNHEVYPGMKRWEANFFVRSRFSPPKVDLKVVHLFWRTPANRTDCRLIDSLPDLAVYHGTNQLEIERE